MEKMIDILRNEFGTNEPIFTKELLALNKGVPKSTLYKKLQRLLEEGEIERAARGIYFIPTHSVLGNSTLPMLKTLVKKYLFDGSTVQGYWGGLMLENQEGLTTQCPTVLEIVTNKATNRLRKLGPYVGYKEVILRPPRIKVTEGNVEALKFLDLVTALPINPEADVVRKIAEKAGTLDATEVLSAMRNYPSITAKRLIENELIDELVR